MGQIDFDGSNSTVKADIIRGQTGTTVKLGGLLDTDGNYIQTEKGGDLTSASPLVIDTDGDYFDVTGTTNFAAMTVAADRQFTLQFDGALTMTHHATNLDLPGEANITTAAGDVATFQSTGSNTVQCISYTKADGTGIAGGGNKKVFVTVKGDSTSNKSSSEPFYWATKLDDGATRIAEGYWQVPSDFSSLTKVEAVFIFNAAGNMYATFTSRSLTHADDGITGGTTDSIAVTTYASPGATDIGIFDVTAMANGLTFGSTDFVILDFERLGGDGNDTVNNDIWFLGYVIEWA